MNVSVCVCACPCLCIWGAGSRCCACALLAALATLAGYPTRRAFPRHTSPAAPVQHSTPRCCFIVAHAAATCSIGLRQGRAMLRHKPSCNRCAIDQRCAKFALGVAALGHSGRRHGRPRGQAEAGTPVRGGDSCGRRRAHRGAPAVVPHARTVQRSATEMNGEGVSPTLYVRCLTSRSSISPAQGPLAGVQAWGASWDESATVAAAARCPPAPWPHRRGARSHDHQATAHACAHHAVP